MSNLFFVSDLHFFHDRIRQYSKRPFSSVEEMNQQLIDNWNAIVKSNDTIYSLGDFSFANYLLTCTVLNQLNGNHHMILGNHDKVISENDTKLLSTGLVKSIQHYKEIKHNGHKIVLFHYPMRTWNNAHYKSILLHGHCHGSISPYGKSVDVGIDSKFIHAEYRPTSIEEVVAYMNNRSFEKVDHHEMDL